MPIEKMDPWGQRTFHVSTIAFPSDPYSSPFVGVQNSQSTAEYRLPRRIRHEREHASLRAHRSSSSPPPSSVPQTDFLHFLGKDGRSSPRHPPLSLLPLHLSHPRRISSIAPTSKHLQDHLRSASQSPRRRDHTQVLQATQLGWRASERVDG